MARKPARRQWNGPLPTTGELVGGVAQIIGWKPRRAAKDSTWRKFIHGQRISDETIQAILGEIAEDLTRDVPPEKRTHEGQVIPLEAVTQSIHQLLVLHSSWWDGLCWRLKSALPVKPTEFTNKAVLRLAIVELAVRLSALLLLQGHRPESTGDTVEPIDMNDFLLPLLLRQVLKREGVTRQRLAEILDVTKEAVDQWLARDGAISVERLDEIAQVLADVTGREPELVKRMLRLIRGWTELAGGLSARVDPNEPHHMVNGLRRMIHFAFPALEAHVAPLDARERNVVLTHLMLLGSACAPGPDIRQAMLARELYDDWKACISTPMDDWEQFLADALAHEQHMDELKQIHAREGFVYLGADEDRVRDARLVGVFLSPERMRSLFGPGFEGTPEQVLDLTWYMLQHYDSEEYLRAEGKRPPAWRMSMEVAEQSRLMVRSARTAHEQLRWEALIWLGYSRGLNQLFKEWTGVNARDDEQEMLAWLERIPDVRRSIPPLPDKVDPRLEGTVNFLRHELILLEHMELMREPLLARRQLLEVQEATEALQARLERKEQEGIPFDEEDEEEVDRITALRTAVHDDTLPRYERSRARRAQLEALMQQFPGLDS